MGRQRSKPQSKGKEDASEGMLNEIETSQLSLIEVKAMVITYLNELTENYQNYKETMMNSLQTLSA